jgi:outer membrane biosynthesis protein TonB
MMELQNLSGLDSFAEIGLRGGVDMRPTLIRVLTDLYMQKLRHTADEEQHYTELALRLLDSVDTATRTAIATRLARHLSPPPRVVQYLVKDLPDVAAPLRNHPVLLQPPAAPIVEPPTAPVVEPPPTPVVEPVLAAVPTPVTEPQPIVAPQPAVTPPSVQTAAPVEALPADEPVEEIAIEESSTALDATVAGELNDLFFTATIEERRLILLNLHVAAPTSPGKVSIVRDPNIGQSLEAAALGDHRDDFTKQLAEALHIPHEQARRIARDDHGEPLVVAVKALGISRDVVYRLLIFVNPAVGHSVERVHTLATLFDEMTAPAAESMIAIWQALRKDARGAAKHQPLLWNDERTRARPAMAPARRPLASSRTGVRREVS